MSESRMAGSKEFRDKIEERKGTEWYDSAKKVGDLYDPHMSRDGVTERYSGAEIRAEMRAGRGDMSTEELTKKYEDLYASGKINLNGNAKEFLRDKHGATLVRNSDGSSGGSESSGGGDSSDSNVIDNISPPENGLDTPISVMPIPGKSKFNTFSQEQNVTQDNDIETEIDGDNNQVTNNQNNSVGQYGGSNGYAFGLKDAYVNKILNG